jgi:hypothetical protein
MKTTKEALHKELAKTPGLWLDTDQLHKTCPGALYTTVSRALRKLRQEKKIVSQTVPNTKGRKQWRINQPVGSPSPATVPSTTSLPGNGQINMNTVKLADAVDAILDDFTRASKTFSAHDVTLELRDRVNTGAVALDPADGTCNVNGADVPRVVHDKVRDHVHAKFEDGELGDYDRTSNGTYMQYSPAGPTSSTDDGDDDNADASSGIAVVAVGGSSYDGSSSL